MVADMFSQDNEADRREQTDQGNDGSTVDAGEAFLDRFNDGELRNVDDGIHRGQCRIVDQLHGGNICKHTDDGQKGSENVTSTDTDDERNELHHLGALDCSDDGRNKGNKTGENRKEVVIADCCVVDVVDSGAAEGKTDERNGRTDDDRREELIDPSRTDEHHDDGDDRVNKTCNQRTEDDTAEAVCTGADQRADECKGRTEEDGRFAAGDENVAKRTDTGTEQCCGRVHIQCAAVAAVDECGDEQGRRDDCQQLLEREDEVLPEFGFFVDVVSQFHEIPPKINFL